PVPDQLALPSLGRETVGGAAARRRKHVGCSERVAMVEAGQTPLGAQIVEVLDDHRVAAGAAEARDIVNGLREGVEKIAGKSAAEAPAQTRLGGVVDGIPVRAVIDESAGVFDRAAIL